MRWNRLVFAVGAVCIVSTLTVILTPIGNYAGQALAVRPELEASDAIVVLGSGMRRDGTLSYESQQRFLIGFHLYKEGLAPLIVLSGPARGNLTPESTVRARMAIEMGIPASAILELGDVATTKDEAQQVISLLQPRNLKHVLLVTESLHMRRSKMVFEATGLTVSAAPSDDFPGIARAPRERLVLTAAVLMHSAGLLYYRLAGYI